MSKDLENQTTATHDENDQHHTNDDRVKSSESSEKNKKMKLFAGSLRFLASIFFICASIYFHYDMWLSDTRDTLDRQGGFFITGFILFFAALVVELPMKMKKGLWTSVLSIIAVLLLLIGGVLILYDVSDDIDDYFDPFAGVFIVGSLMLCACQIVDLVVYLRQDDGTKAMVISMTLAILGSTLFFLGGAFHIERVVNAAYYTSSAVERYAGLLITGSVLYLFHGLFYLIDAAN